jgi:hypothetical protein
MDAIVGKPTRQLENRTGTLPPYITKTKPFSGVTEGPVFEIARTAILPPESMEGFISPQQPPPQKWLLLFLLGFFLCRFFLSCHRHLLLGLHGWAFNGTRK